MKILKVGDKGRAACDECAAFVPVSYKLKDVPFSDASGIVRNVLVGVCGKCDSVCVLPHQSTPSVKHELEQQRQSVEARVPAHMLDILNLAATEVGSGTSFAQSMIKYYIHAMVGKKISTKKLADYLKSDLAGGKAEKRISLKGHHVHDEITELKSRTQMDSNSSLIKSVILKINDDILQKKRSKPLSDLRGIAAAFD